MADNANLYDDLQTTDWSNGATEIVYEYYDTGALKTKTVSGTDPHIIDYEYNFQNRLSRVTETRGGVVDITEYTYNYAGIRVKSHSWTQGQSNDVYKTYLIDSYNHTGYAQVLEEWSDGTTPDVTYTLGDDVVSQSKAGVVRHLLYDGHGSTRQLSYYDSTPGVEKAVISDSYSYDAYGMMLGGNPTKDTPAATNLLYTGEQYDNNLQQYYLRARYYDPSNGRFNRLDPYSGNNQDPQSLHKYLYCHANPVNGIDPSGMMTLAEVKVTVLIGVLVFAMAYQALRPQLEESAMVLLKTFVNIAVSAVQYGTMGFRAAIEWLKYQIKKLWQSMKNVARKIWNRLKHIYFHYTFRERTWKILGLGLLPPAYVTKDIYLTGSMARVGLNLWHHAKPPNVVFIVLPRKGFGPISPRQRVPGGTGYQYILIKGSGGPGTAIGPIPIPPY